MDNWYYLLKNYDKFIKIDSDEEILYLIKKNKNKQYSEIIEIAIEYKLEQVKMIFNKVLKNDCFTSFDKPKLDLNFIPKKNNFLYKLLYEHLHLSNMSKENLKKLLLKIKQEQLSIKNYYKLKIVNYINSKLVKAEITHNHDTLNEKLLSSLVSCECLTLPKSIKYINPGCFNGLSKLKKIYFKGTIFDWINIKINLNDQENFLKDKQLFMVNEKNEYVENKIVNFPSNISSINEYQFYEFEMLEEFKASKGLLEIKEKAFYNCKNLKKICLPATIKKITRNAFIGCDIKEFYYSGSLEEWMEIKFIGYGPDLLNRVENFYFYDYDKKDYIEKRNIKKITVTAIEKFLSSYENLPGIDVVIFPKKISLEKEVKLYYKIRKLECSISALHKIDFFEYELVSNYSFQRKRKVFIDEVIINDGQVISFNTFEDFFCINRLILPETINEIFYNAFSKTEIKNIYFNGTLEMWENINILCGELFIDNILKIFVHDDNNNFVDVSEIVLSEKIAKKFFKSVSWQKNIIVPDYVREMNNGYLFLDNTQEIDLGNGLVNINESAFEGALKLCKITFSKSVKFIGERAFNKCNSIKYVYFKGTIEDWCNIDFQDNEASPINVATSFFVYDENNNFVEPKKVVLSTNVKKLSLGQFKMISSLEEIILPSSINIIPEYAFEKCENLKKIIIPKSITSISDWAFLNCKNLNDVYYEGTIEEWNKISFGKYHSNPMSNGCAFHYLDQANNWITLDELIIPEGETQIGENDYINYNGVRYLSIPESITKLAEFALFRFRLLKSIKLPYFNNFRELYPSKTLEEIEFINGTSFDTSFSFDAEYKKLSLPQSTRKIKASLGRCSIESLYYCGSVEDWCKVTIADSIIASNVYMVNNDNWELVTDITISSKKIKANQFRDFGSLKRVVLKDSTVEIEDAAFMNCEHLEEVIFSNKLTKIGKYAFYNCKKLKKVIIPTSINFIDDYAFENCSSLQEIIIPHDKIDFGKYVFSYCENIVKLFLPNKNIDENNISIYDLVDSCIFSGSKADEIYYIGTINDYIETMKKYGINSIFSKVKKVFLKTYNNDCHEMMNPIKSTIISSVKQFVDFDKDLFITDFDINTPNCFITILKKVSHINKKSTKNSWMVFVSCFIEELTNVIQLSNNILEEIKEKYPYLLIRSDVYISISSLFVDSNLNGCSIFYYSDDYTLVNVEGTEIKEKAYSVENIYEEFENIKAKNSDVMDCVRAYTGTIEIFDLTKEKLSSIYSTIKHFTDNGQKGRILIEGPARSGKTIIAFKLLKKFKKSKFLLMNYYFYRAIKDAFYAYNVEFPHGRLYHHDLNPNRESGCGVKKGNKDNGWQNSFLFDLDFVIVDEAQRLSNLPGKQGEHFYFPGFDELDIMLKNSNISIYLGDDNQRLNHKTENGGFGKIKQILNKEKIDYYEYHFSETIGIPNYLFNSIKYILSGNENFKDNILDFKIELTDNLGEFANGFKSEITDKKHYAYIPGGDISYDKLKVGYYGLNFEAYDVNSDFFLNQFTQEKYLYSTYQMISRELEVLYLYIPAFVSYVDGKGIVDKKELIPQEFLLNHLYVNMTRGTRKLVIYTADENLYDYLARQIRVVSNKENEIKWKDKKVVDQKINFVVSYSSRDDIYKLYDKIKEYGFEGFVHAADYNTIDSILSSNKLLSRNDSTGLFVDIADKDVICRTSEFVKNKVRFYYKQNTPTYYHFNRFVENLVILQFDYLLMKDYSCYFSDGNAASQYSKITGLVNEALKFDWETIFERGAIPNNLRKHIIIRKRDAELLVEGPVDVNKYLKKIIVKDESIAEKIGKKYSQYRGIIVIDPNSFS